MPPPSLLDGRKALLVRDAASYKRPLSSGSVSVSDSACLSVHRTAAANSCELGRLSASVVMSSVRDVVTAISVAFVDGFYQTFVSRASWETVN